MMRTIRANKILLGFVALNAAYFSFGFFPSGIWLTSFVSACLVVSGAMLAAASLPDAIDIAKKGEIGPGELAVVAIFTIALGLTYSGVFSVLWNFSGRPHSWIGPFSAYGRAMSGVGLLLMFLSPEATRQGIRPPKWWVMLIGILMVAFLAFVFGISWSEQARFTGIVDSVRGPSGLVELWLFRRA